MDSAHRHSLPRFRRYRDKRGHSAVTGYAALAKSIAVQFADGAIYLYDMDCPGPQHVERMKELARAGEGLYTYINRRIGRRYSSQLDSGSAATPPGRTPPSGSAIRARAP